MYSLLVNEVKHLGLKRCEKYNEFQLRNLLEYKFIDIAFKDLYKLYYHKDYRNKIVKHIKSNIKFYNKKLVKCSETFLVNFVDVMDMELLITCNNHLSENFLRHSEQYLNWENLSYHYGNNLSISFLSDFKYKINWKKLSYKINSIDVIRHFKDYIEWNIVTPKVYEIGYFAIKEFENYVDWDIIKTYKLSLSFIYDFKHKLDFKYILENNIFSNEFLTSIEDYLDWESVSKYQNLSISFIKKYHHKLDWKLLSKWQRLNEKLIKKNEDKVDWNYISQYQKNLSENFIDKFYYNLNWYYISRYQKLSIELIEKYYNKVDWYYICIYQKLSESFIEKYKNNIDFHYICIYQKLSETFIEKHKDFVDWKNISKYQKLSEAFIEKHKDFVDWVNISRYQNLSFSFVKLFLHKINFKCLKHNKKIKKEVKELIFKTYNKIIENEECSICFEKGDVLVKTICNHIFHKYCIDKWLIENINCPMCRFIFFMK